MAGLVISSINTISYVIQITDYISYKGFLFPLTFSYMISKPYVFLFPIIFSSLSKVVCHSSHYHISLSPQTPLGSPQTSLTNASPLIKPLRPQVPLCHFYSVLHTVWAHMKSLLQSPFADKWSSTTVCSCPYLLFSWLAPIRGVSFLSVVFQLFLGMYSTPIYMAMPIHAPQPQTISLPRAKFIKSFNIGQAQPLPFLHLNSIIYIPCCPFISVSKPSKTLDCTIIFVDNFEFIQDKSTSRTTGARHESHELYHLTTFPYAFANSLDMLHDCLDHSSLSKLQKTVLSLPFCL